MPFSLFPPKETVLNFSEALSELDDVLQDLSDGLFAGEVSSGPFAEEGFERIGAQVSLPSHDIVYCAVQKKEARNASVS
jgi:hypothetical protein